jgi:hypothetical protein
MLLLTRHLSLGSCLLPPQAAGVVVSCLWALKLDQ